MDTPLIWRKSSWSGPNGQQCVEAARIPGAHQIAARDSKQPAGPHLCFDSAVWRRFVDSVKAGQFELG
ncbi:MAG TPA: DUF397 domain-containing protein [Streptosporangiaceae bacterium]